MAKGPRNKFEARGAEVLKGLCDYEPYKMPYVTYRHYTPDFVGQSKGKEILVELKGYFRVGDTAKYKAIRDCLKSCQELIFVLYDHKTKVRKGAKMNMGQWCEKEGIRWYDLEEIADVFTI